MNMDVFHIIRIYFYLFFLFIILFAFVIYTRLRTTYKDTKHYYLPAFIR